MAHPHSLMIEVIDTPKSFPRLQPIGPQRPPRDWPSPQSIDLKAPESLNLIYVIWITGAEDELCDVHDLVDTQRDAYVGRKGECKTKRVVALTRSAAKLRHLGAEGVAVKGLWASFQRVFMTAGKQQVAREWDEHVDLFG